jgi:nucleotide-binding universal stress UspA family protein
MISLKKILYPTDFSEFSRCAMPYAMEFSRHFESQLHCLHVVEPTYLDSMLAAETHEPTITDQIGSMQQRMQEFVDEYLKDDQEHVVSKVISGHPFEEIIGYARNQEIDLIILATHGHGALSSMLLGSITEKVVRKSPCPIMTVRHPEHEFVMP